MSGRLQNKVIIVAGAGGIGTGLATRYASEGASVVLGDIDRSAAESAAKTIASSGGTIAAIGLDGSDDGSIKAAVDYAVSTYGGLDGLHANFANFRDGTDSKDVLGLDMDVYDDVMRVNARGFILCTRHAIPAMLARRGGSIVYTSSGAAHMGEPVRLAYAMSKAAIHALARHVANRFGAQGIRANVIAPGVIAYPRLLEVMPQDVRDDMQARTAVQHLGEPADIAAMGALLLSDDGKFVTGQVISVDGGTTMRP